MRKNLQLNGRRVGARLQHDTVPTVGRADTAPAYPGRDASAQKDLVADAGAKFADSHHSDLGVEFWFTESRLLTLPKKRCTRYLFPLFRRSVSVVHADTRLGHLDVRHRRLASNTAIQSLTDRVLPYQ